MKDLDRIACGLPLVSRHDSPDGRPSYKVKGVLFCCHRGQRPDAVDERGQRLDDVLMFRVAGPEAKAAMLADPAAPYFTTPHFNGYPAVLLRIKDLRRLDRDELFELVADAWLTRAPKRVAAAWLSEHVS
jgi:hypothetical protein